MAAEVGSKAPDFTLVNQDRENVTLSQELAKGNVVLAFFPGAFSGTCTKEFCNFRDTMSNFRNLNAKVLGISTDTFFTLKAWDDQQKLGFPLLSDYNKEVINKYGVVNPDMIGLKNIAKRAVFVIDKSGVVRYREVLEDARNEPDYAKLNEALANLANKPVACAVCEIHAESVFKIDGMDCREEVAILERRLKPLPGLEDLVARPRRAAAARALRRREAVDRRHRRGGRADGHARVARARGAGRPHGRGDRASGASSSHPARRLRPACCSSSSRCHSRSRAAAICSQF